MSLELVNAIATLGTFLVIAATAIVAVVQLSHARSSNLIAALNELRETTEAPEFHAARHFVVTELASRLGDAAFRYQLAKQSARTEEFRPLIAKIHAIGNFYENMGVLLKAGLIDRDLALDIWNWNVVETWESLAPVTAIVRREQGSETWENFEYLTVLAQDWVAAHPKGTYPADVRRIELKDEWLDIDRQYATSLVTA